MCPYLLVQQYASASRALFAVPSGLYILPLTIIIMLASALQNLS